jgi:hypothetical protein
VIANQPEECELHELAELELSSAAEASAGEGERPDRRQHTNRRQFPRYQLTTQADYVAVESGARGSARSSDISLGGCYLDSTTPHPEGTRLKLQLSREGRTFESLAEVVVAMPGMGMGLRFIDTTSAARRVLEGWIGEITGVAPLPPVPAQSEEPANTPVMTPLRPPLKNDTRYLVMELIVLLMRKGVVEESEGEHLLRRLN